MCVLVIEKCIARPVAPRGCPLASSPTLGLTTYFPPYYRSKSRQPMRAEREATYDNVPTLDEAMHIVEGAESECRVIHELPKKRWFCIRERFKSM